MAFHLNFCIISSGLFIDISEICHFKEEEKKKEDKQKDELKDFPPDNHFNLVCLKKWEDDIIWSSEDYKPKENSAALRSLAGCFAGQLAGC